MSKTLQQIVDEADTAVGNAFTDDMKVSYLDDLQRELYRKFDTPERIETITTVANQGLYTLPDYIIPSRIKTVTLTDSDGGNPTELDRRGYTEALSGSCYYTLETSTASFIRVFPTPTEAGAYIVICFKDSPNTLSSSDMSTIPRFFGDYHGILVAGLAARIALWRKDTDLMAYWKTEYNRLLQEAIDELFDATPTHIKCVY